MQENPLKVKKIYLSIYLKIQYILKNFVICSYPCIIQPSIWFSPWRPEIPGVPISPFDPR